MILDIFLKQPEIHPKGWGREIWIANSEMYCGKILELQKGKRCSIHYHKLKDETFYILSGHVQMNIHNEGYLKEPTILFMKPGETLHIPQLLIHQFIGIEDSKILEISTQHFEEDSYRLLKGD
ncbi:MAG: cupin domain-containing protein [Nanoarchaeota archaeon]|mgnify:CR=1 FL=1